jgi:hypothetical protein
MALNFNPASFNPVVAGFDDLGSAVVAALGRRAERQYATEAAKRQRQQQLADLAYQTANPEDLTETDITGFDPALQAAARTRKTGAKRSAYEKRWGDTRNALGDLGRGSRAGAALGASLGADRLSLATSKEADDQAEADYQAILKGMGSPTILTEIMEPGIGGAAPTPTGRYAEAPDPDYRSRVEMGMRKKMAELMTSGGPNARVLGRKIFTRHGDLLGDPRVGKEGPIDFRSWLDSTDAVATPGASAGAILGAKPGLSETAKARIRLMLADPDTPLFQSPQQIEVWRSLLAEDEAPAAPTAQPEPWQAPAWSMPTWDAAPPSGAAAALGAAEPTRALPPGAQPVPPAMVRAAQSTSPNKPIQAVRAEVGPAPRLIDFDYDDAGKMAATVTENLGAVEQWLAPSDPNRVIELKANFDNISRRLASGDKTALKSMQALNRALVKLAGQPLARRYERASPMAEALGARGY